MVETHRCLCDLFNDDNHPRCSKFVLMLIFCSDEHPFSFYDRVQRDKRDPPVPPVCQELRVEPAAQGLLDMRDTRVIPERLDPRE